MSREIKFRAWNMPFGSDGPMQRMTHGRAGDILKFAEMDPDNYIVEQFTGLWDSNGQKIYEGDIVRYTAEDESSFVGPVEYMANDDYPAFDIPSKYLPHQSAFESNVLSTGMTFEKLEVIGNVHANPELLEAEK